MVHTIELFGVGEIKAAMRKADKNLAMSSKEGLTKAALFLQRASQKKTPVLTGNLKNSAGTHVSGMGWRAEAVVYYTAAYAVYVHERVDSHHKKGEAKFLENAARLNREKILAIIQGTMEAKMKGKNITGGGGPKGNSVPGKGGD